MCTALKNACVIFKWQAGSIDFWIESREKGEIIPKSWQSNKREREREEANLQIMDPEILIRGEVGWATPWKFNILYVNLRKNVILMQEKVGGCPLSVGHPDATCLNSTYTLIFISYKCIWTLSVPKPIVASFIDPSNWQSLTALHYFPNLSARVLIGDNLINIAHVWCLSF